MVDYPKFSHTYNYITHHHMHNYHNCRTVLNIPLEERSSSHLCSIKSKFSISNASLSMWICFIAVIKHLQLALVCLSSHNLNISEQHTLQSVTPDFIVYNASVSFSFSNSVPKSSHFSPPAAHTVSLTYLFMYFISGRSSTV